MVTDTDIDIAIISTIARKGKPGYFDPAAWVFQSLPPSSSRMGGRGRGRGGPGLSFNAEAMGFGRGDAMPGTQLAPPPTFPPLDNQVRSWRGAGGGANIVVLVE